MRIPTLFPALASPTLFFDNAGGSQLPRCVIEAIHSYLQFSYVQLGADYELSRRATATIARARDVVRCFLNAGLPDSADPASTHPTRGDVIFGPSTTALCYQLAAAYADARDAEHPGLAPRDQIIVCTAGHEANVGPWMRLASRGFEVIPWQAEPVTTTDRELHFRPSLATLKNLLSSRTLVVLYPQVSNILGEVWDARAVADLAHAAGARVLVDGVAYAPHRAPDMAALACDWYVYSTYKVFGPHMAALFGTHQALAELTGPNHYFIDGGPYKWELGGTNHESCAGVAALWDYIRELESLAGRQIPATLSRAPFESAFGLIQQLEEALQAQLLSFLKSKPGVRIVGPAAADSSRIATISFTSSRLRPRDISAHLARKNMGIRWGHAYSKRLCEAMGLDSGEGVARVSLLHYNTPQEVDRLCAALDEVL